MGKDGDTGHRDGGAGASLQGVGEVARARIADTQVRISATAYEIDLLLEIDGGGSAVLTLSHRRISELIRRIAEADKADEQKAPPKESNH